MPRTATVNVNKGVWTEITDSATTGAVVFLNHNATSVKIKGTTGTTAPTNLDGCLTYQAGQGDSRTIDELFPGSGFERLWVYSQSWDVSIPVNHA